MPGASRLTAYWDGHRGSRCAVLSLDPERFATNSRIDPRLGELRVLQGAEDLAGGEIQSEVEFAVCGSAPLLLWRIGLTNRSSRPLRLVRLGMLESPDDGGAGGATIDGLAAPPAGRGGSAGLSFFSQGWQSWGFAGSLGATDRYPHTRLGPLTLPRANPSTPRPSARGLFASDMFGVLCDRTRRSGLLAGFLSQQAAFGSLLADLRSLPPTLRLWAELDGVTLEPAGSFVSDWACLLPVELDAVDPLRDYLELAARQNGARVQSETPVGWCSWYSWFEDVTERVILDNLAWAEAHRDEAPLTLIQLDDGFQTRVGDWRSWKSTFPSGPAALRAEVRERGFRPGLWLAPFIVKPRSRIALDHPDWLLRGRHGRPVNAGFAWNTLARALDTTHPGVTDHLTQLLETVVGVWGFDYLKLDFLYAGALPGRRHDPRLTRAQALRAALEKLRAAAGEDTTLVGCGCPLGPAIGLVDAMRIGTDVAPRWRPAFGGLERPFRREPDMPATRGALRNTLTRSMMHRRWWINDPDCLLIRPGDERPPEGAPAGFRSRLTANEAQFLATVVALSAGSLIISDDLPHLDRSRASWLARLIPPLPRAARVVDLFDGSYPSLLVLPIEGAIGAWHLVALLNWEDGPRSLEVDLGLLGVPPAKAYHAIDFWQAQYHRLHTARLQRSPVPGHTAVLLAVRPAGSEAQWLGDTLHISQGLSLRSWEASGRTVRAELELGRRAHGTVWLALPSVPARAALDGHPLELREVASGVYAMELETSGRGELRLGWE